MSFLGSPIYLGRTFELKGTIIGCQDFNNSLLPLFSTQSASPMFPLQKSLPTTQIPTCLMAPTSGFAPLTPVSPILRFHRNDEVFGSSIVAPLWTLQATEQTRPALRGFMGECLIEKKHERRTSLEKLATAPILPQDIPLPASPLLQGTLLPITPPTSYVKKQQPKSKNPIKKTPTLKKTVTKNSEVDEESSGPDSPLPITPTKSVGPPRVEEAITKLNKGDKPGPSAPKVRLSKNDNKTDKPKPKLKSALKNKSKRVVKAVQFGPEIDRGYFVDGPKWPNHLASILSLAVIPPLIGVFVAVKATQEMGKLAKKFVPW